MRKIIVVPYDDRWPEMFEAESLLIKTLLGGGEARRFKAQFALKDDEDEDEDEDEEGIVTGQSSDSTVLTAFIDAMKAHRVLARSTKALSIPA